MLVVEQGSGREFDSKYQMLWAGEWRPVYALFDNFGVPTTLAIRASRAVLWLGAGRGFLATVCSPGELYERRGRDMDALPWEYID